MVNQELFSQFKHTDDFDVENLIMPTELFKDTFSLLRQRGVPVVLIAGIGWRDDIQYSEKALYRAKHQINFSAVVNKLRFRNHRKEVYGKRPGREGRDYFKELGHAPPLYWIGFRMLYSDEHSSIVHFENGQKRTAFQPTDAKRRMHIYGQCTVMGGWVADEETIPSQLQKRLLQDEDLSDIRVDNRGIGAVNPLFHLGNFILDAPTFDEDDIVILYEIFPNVIGSLKEAGCDVININPYWPDNEISRSCWVDNPFHMGPAALEQTAEILYQTIKRNGIGTSIRELPHDGEYNVLKEFLTSNSKDPTLEKATKKYIESIQREIPVEYKNTKNRGAIVMNADPFTSGHRYLVEYAASRVDLLFVFCASADTSFFSSDDRFEMVKRGVADLPNVVVASSGRVFANTETFPEYHITEISYDKQELGAKDIYLFSNYIAKGLGISKRFVGEEAPGSLTSFFNDHMARVLPAYGIELEIIPRLEHGGVVVSASVVRDCITRGRLADLKEIVPKTTYDYICKKKLHINEDFDDEN